MDKRTVQKSQLWQQRHVETLNNLYFLDLQVPDNGGVRRIAFCFLAFVEPTERFVGPASTYSASSSSLHMEAHARSKDPSWCTERFIV